MNPIKPTLRSELLPGLLIILAIAASFYFYPNFPDQVPIHWNMAGQPDNWGSRAIAAFLFPGIMLGMYIVFLVLPLLDPKKNRYEQFRKVYHIFKLFIIALMAALYFITGLNALGYNVPVGLWVPILVGLLFIIIGNYMGKIKPNWFIGIRTPWTLSSEEVWNKTHRLGGKLFILGGLVMIAMPFLPLSWRGPLLIAMVIILSLGTFGYSYFLYLEEKKNGKINN